MTVACPGYFSHLPTSPTNCHVVPDLPTGSRVIRDRSGYMGFFKLTYLPSELDKGLKLNQCDKLTFSTRKVWHRRVNQILDLILRLELPLAI